MAFTYDLFISYRSTDRVWATKLHDDLHARFPHLKLFFDQKPASIAPGAAYRPALENAIPGSVHMVALWSKHARESTEVTNEIANFASDRRYNAGPGGQRTLFYVPLDDEFSALDGYQGFKELFNLKTYDARAADLGVSKLAADPHATEWNRIVDTIGTTAQRAGGGLPLLAGVLTLTDGSIIANSGATLLNGMADVGGNNEPTLNQVLGAAGLTLADVQQTRYGPTGFGWKPFGTNETITDFLRDVTVQANATLSREKSPYQFTCEPLDLLAHYLSPPAGRTFVQLLDEMIAQPSIMIVDPIALHHPVAMVVFGKLRRYAYNRHSLMITLALTSMPVAELGYRAARALTEPVLGEYFNPSIPPLPATSTMGLVGLQVQYRGDVERLLRGSIANYDEQRRREASVLVTMAGRQ